MTAATLDPKHMRFADEYLIDFNGGAAYARAGYKSKGAAAHAAASRLLARPDVQGYLAKRREELQAKIEVTQEQVVARIAFMALGDIRKLRHPDGRLKELHELTAEEASLIQGFEIDEIYAPIGRKKAKKDSGGDESAESAEADSADVRLAIGRTTKFKLVNRLDAAKVLGQHLGMFTKKHEHSGPNGGPIPVSGVGDLLNMIDGADTGPGAAASRKQ
ncbi:MAG: terminase small subunit [Lysobacter sp.]